MDRAAIFKWSRQLTLCSPMQENDTIHLTSDVYPNGAQKAPFGV
jgi:hypothetical protein